VVVTCSSGSYLRADETPDELRICQVFTFPDQINLVFDEFSFTTADGLEHMLGFVDPEITRDNLRLLGPENSTLCRKYTGGTLLTEIKATSENDLIKVCGFWPFSDMLILFFVLLKKFSCSCGFKRFFD